MTEDLTLREIRESDLNVLDRIMNEPAAAGPFQWYGWRNPGGFRRRWAENGLISDDSGMLLVVRRNEGIGFVSWRKMVTAIGSFCWNTGIALLPESRGQGCGTRAQRLLVRYLFDHTQVNRIEAGTDVDNVAERRALEKSGFRLEGVMRGYGFRLGEWHDVALYSVLRADTFDAPS